MGKRRGEQSYDRMKTVGFKTYLYKNIPVVGGITIEDLEGFKGLDLDIMVTADAPFDALSWTQGFLSACRTFGVWKDGDQYLGSGGDWTVAKVRKEIEKFIREQK